MSITTEERQPSRKAMRHPRPALEKSEHPLRLKSLLVPTDFSPPSSRGLDCAVGLAQRFGSQIKLLHVVDFPKIFNDKRAVFADWDKGIIEQAKARLQALQQDKIDEFIPANTEVRSGRAYEQICEAAEDHGSDLVVISTHGYSGLKHLLLGSVAERVVRHAPCSVLVTRGRAPAATEPKLNPKRILVPTDFSDSSLEAVDYALSWAREYQAEIYLLHVIPSCYATTDEMVREVCILEAELKHTSEKELAALMKILRSQEVPIRTNTRHGRPATEIAEAAGGFQADLIVMSTHGLTGWNRALLGSTTEEVVRHAPCPVLVVRNKSKK